MSQYLLRENHTSKQNAFTIDNITDGQWSTTIQYFNTKQGNIIILLKIIFIITGVLLLNNYNV